VASDSWYRVVTHDWPAVTAAPDLASADVFRLIDSFDDYYQAAIRGLGSTPVRTEATAAPSPADDED